MIIRKNVNSITYLPHVTPKSQQGLLLKVLYRPVYHVITSKGISPILIRYRSMSKNRNPLRVENTGTVKINAHGRTEDDPPWFQLFFVPRPSIISVATGSSREVSDRMRTRGFGQPDSTGARAVEHPTGCGRPGVVERAAHSSPGGPCSPCLRLSVAQAPHRAGPQGCWPVPRAPRQLSRRARKLEKARVARCLDSGRCSPESSRASRFSRPQARPARKPARAT